jgi:hypothetical protein
MTCRAFLAAFFSVLLVPAAAYAQDPQPPVVTGEYSCFVGEHAGIDDADARTTSDLVCGELVLVNAPAGAYDVRFGKLGSRILLGVRARTSGEDRRILIQNFDEVPVAARRLVAALVARTTFEKTEDVDNVVSAESRLPKAKKLPVTVFVGLVGMTGAGEKAGASAGIDVSVMFRSGRLSFGPELRAGGLGSGDNKLGFGGADVAIRYSFSDADVSPFVGAGLGLSYLKANRAARWMDYGTIDDSPEGSGLGAHVEGGVELMRRNHAGAILSLRVDAPFFALKNDSGNGDYGYSYGVTPTRTTQVTAYVVPLSVNVGFAFR